ncbi:hypothetical protein CBR_g25904 [Chara braunii]|uniref:Integrase catalytic domain-containing protein n=1 Tax=Chara braunii TaxID=69332 RepID=A0A388L6Z3_CHABU|nr:hypothetical protein CBR_g25904 [Chara braunii]|eukprot:GBG77973.1 hypothetical protein CBR_g25904 [Chara braunii]
MMCVVAILVRQLQLLDVGLQGIQLIADGGRLSEGADVAEHCDDVVDAFLQLAVRGSTAGHTSIWSWYSLLQVQYTGIECPCSILVALHCPTETAKREERERVGVLFASVRRGKRSVRPNVRGERTPLESSTDTPSSSIAVITSDQWQVMLDAADESQKPFFQKLYDDAVQREREAAAAARAADIADQVALLRIPEANADRFREELAADVAALVRLRNLKDLESRVTALEQWNQELQAKVGNQEVVTSTHAVKGVRITFDKDRTVTHELNFYVLDKCPFDAVIGLGWLKAHCLRTTWADNQFVVLDAKGNERTVLLDKTRESPVTLLSANKFCSHPVLRIADPNLTFVVTTDASQFGIGAVLQQDDGDGLRPLEYYSKRMPNHKVATSTYMRELYALREALTHWKHYLSGHHFKVYSDHQTLQWIKTQTDLSPTLTHWLHDIDVFNFELKHKKGCYNRVANALSRHPEYLTCPVDSYDLRGKLKEDLIEHTAKDPDLSPILGQLKADPNSQPDFHECDGLVFRRYGKFDRLCVPNHAPLRTYFLDLAHGRSGHFGFEKTYGSLLQQFDWSGMKGSAQKFIAECQVCQRTKVHRHKPYGLLRPLPIPDGPGESVSIDFTDMGKVSTAGNSQVMVIVDRFSKFLNLIPLPPHAPTELVIEEFHQQYILQYEPPRTLDLHKVKGLYNNSIHSATGVTPNQLPYGWPMRNPLSYLFPERSPGLMPDMPGYNAKYARLLKVVTAAMNKRQHAMIKHANKLRREEKFKVGDYVWVKMSEFSDEEGVSRKLLPQYYGPWQILKVIGDDFGPSYVIDVPPHLRTYPVFHASKLFPHIDDETFPFRDPMIPRPIDGGHEIDRIVSHEGRGRNKQYKVHFLHHPLNEFFWIDRKELLKSGPRVVNAYKRQIVDGQTAKFAAKLTPFAANPSSGQRESTPKFDGQEIFCDSTKTDPIPWFRKFELTLQLHLVSEYKHHTYLYSRSGGECQAWMSNLLSKYRVIAAELHTKISWDDLKAAWHKRFQVELPEIKAMDKLMVFEQGTLPSTDWIAEYQRLTSVPDIQMGFKAIHHYFISRSCPTLSNALTHVEDTLTTTAKLFDKATQIIVTNEETKNLRSSAAGPSRDQYRPKVAVIAAAMPFDQSSEAVSANEGDKLAAAREGGRPDKGRGCGKAKTNTASSPGPDAAAPAPWSQYCYGLR